MEINKSKKFVILPSKDEYMHARLQGGVYYYYLPKEKYESYKANGGVLDNREILEKEAKMAELKYEKETEKVLDIIDINRKKRNNNNIELYAPRQVQRRDVSPKRNIKNSPSKAKNKKCKSSKKDYIKASVAAALIVIGMAAGVCGIEKQIDNTNRYNETAATVETMSDDEIRESIEDILKQEISEATGEKVEDIRFSQHSIDSATQRTEVKVGENEYTYDDDLRSPVNIGNTLKSYTIKELIDETNSSSTDRKSLIKALMKAQKFSKEKDLVVEGKKLKEVKAQEIDDEER